jgi:hypothetical protein
MRFGVTLPTSGVGDDPRVMVDLAVEAEGAGWDGVFIWDVPIAGPEFGQEVQKVHEAWTLLGAMALRTERVLLGTMITPLAWRQPWMVAKQASTVQALSRGRLVLSVGLGAPPPDGTYFYEPTDRKERAQRLDEGLQILEGLWAGEPLHFEGKHFRSRNSPTLLPVVSPRPTVWVVGAWNHDPKAWPKKRSFRRALKWDGLLPHFYEGSTMIGGPFKPEGISLLAEDVRRERNEPFDLVVEGGGTEDNNAPADQVGELAEAGATWWLEAVWESMYRHPGDPSAMRDRIRSGPPRI